MIRPIYWIGLVVAGVFSVLLLTSAISARTSEQTIYDVTSQDCLDIIQSALADHNTNFSVEDLSVVDAQYVNNNIAVVKTNTSDGQRINFLFELYNGTVYLTNYSTGSFTSEELNNPDLLHYISDAIDA